jgi:hypothetical protein
MFLNGLLEEIDFNGNVQWIKNYENGTSLNYVFKNSDGYLFFCTSDGSASFDSNYGENVGFSGAYVMQTDTNGNEKWTKLFGRINFDSLLQTSDGKYLIIYGDIIEKMSATGSSEWLQINLQLPYDCVIQASDGGYIFMGSNSLGFWIVKAAETGTTHFDQTPQPYTSPEVSDGSAVTDTQRWTTDVNSSIISALAVIAILVVVAVAIFYVDKRSKAKRVQFQSGDSNVS